MRMQADRGRSASDKTGTFTRNNRARYSGTRGRAEHLHGRLAAEDRMQRLQAYFTLTILRVLADGEESEVEQARTNIRGGSRRCTARS